jgi:Protein of unknown function (DUF1236)
MRLRGLAFAAATLLCGAAFAQNYPSGGSDQTPNPHEQPGDQTRQPGAQPRNAGPEQAQPGGEMNRPVERTQLQRDEQYRSTESTRLQGGEMLRGGEVRGGNARPLSIEQRTTLRETVLRAGPRVTNVNFRIGVGAVVPRSVRLVAVPQPILAIYPEWAGDLFFTYGDEIVVVAPDTMEIVGVLPV